MPPEVNAFSWIFFIFMCLWTGIALFATINPYYFWKLAQSWKALREPPRAYFVFQRIISGVFALIGLSILLLPHLLR
ncbi:DUF6199 family natural product biosynthesis protein [Cohnella herbarum]|uniref:DUF6199 domain-containing protein n=1 Tax=Cohnella herbarum TaxID=2728023 RepID=A0A7Z2VHQ4_9BACL|nr:DUF6199 family natural product biosynthesis protein [Cohnella herbarum]QJD83115.1 hypothetical protein HH215_07965 [Cohnella herbarum]